MTHPSQIKNPSLSQQGQLNLELAERQMGALMKIRERFQAEKPFDCLRIGMALHITKETGILVRTLRDGGAEVVITGCNPLSTQDDIAAALALEKDVTVYGYKGESEEDYYRYLNYVLESKPQLLIDDGCDLVTTLVTSYPEQIPEILGGCEETTTGVQRLRAMETAGALPFPVIAVNDNLTKHLMDNYYGTGQSTIDGILRASNILFSGKTVVIAGYGSCGKGCALRASGLGAQVIVTEIDPFRALQAHMDGLRVMPMSQAAPLGDIFITVTGNLHVLRPEHFEVMKDNTILCNSGHFDCEIDLKGLEALSTSVRQVRPAMQEYHLPNGRSLFVLGEGRLVNLAAAEGHPSEVMSLSFCGQALACEYLVKEVPKGLSKGVHGLPVSVDEMISRLQLQALELSIDQLTSEQETYIKEWKSGT